VVSSELLLVFLADRDCIVVTGRHLIITSVFELEFRLPPHHFDNQIKKSLLSKPTGHERCPRGIREGQNGTEKGVSPSSADNRGGGRVEARANCRDPSTSHVLRFLVGGGRYQCPYPLLAPLSPSTAIFPLSNTPPALNILSSVTSCATYNLTTGVLIIP
jgi:hypothetical protein